MVTVCVGEWRREWERRSAEEIAVYMKTYKGTTADQIFGVEMTSDVAILYPIWMNKELQPK